MLGKKEGFKIIGFHPSLISEDKKHFKSDLPRIRNKLKKNKKVSVLVKWYDEYDTPPYSLLFKEDGKEEYQIVGEYKRNEEIKLPLENLLPNIKYNFAIAKRNGKTIISTNWEPYIIPSYIEESLGLLGFFEYYFLKRDFNFIYVKYFHATTTLEPWQLVGLLRLSGFKEKQALRLIKKNFRKINLISGPKNSLPFKNILEIFIKTISNKKGQNSFRIISQFLVNSWERKFKKPFFIFISGSSSSGKDILVNMLREYLVLDRTESTDTLRNQVCRELIREYGSLQNMDESTKQMFSATYYIGIEGFKFQCQKVGEKIKEWIRNCTMEMKYFNRPIFILQGVNIDPAIADKILKPAKNKLFVVLNPPKQILKNRVFARWEREKGALTHKQFLNHLNTFEQSSLIQEYLVKEAMNKGYPIISEYTRKAVFQHFSKLLIEKLHNIP